MNVTIRPLQVEDAKVSVVWRNTPDLWVHTKFKATHKITLQNEMDWIEKVTSDPTCARFAIIADDQYVGNIYLTDIADGEAEYHIFIGEKAYWGKGVARKASELIIDYGESTLKLERIKLLVKKENAGAYHLYATLGFIETYSADDGFVEMMLNLDKSSDQSRDTIK